MNSKENKQIATLFAKLCTREILSIGKFAKISTREIPYLSICTRKN